MPTCPDCGSIIMEGDPYCSHCGAHLSWSDDYNPRRDSQIPNPPIDFYDSPEDIRESERRHQELIKKICDYYKVELEDLDVKDTYTEYIFLRKTPYYTLKVVGTDKYGGIIGIKPNAFELDYTKLKENKDYQELIKGLDVKNTYVGLRVDVIHIETENEIYRVDMDNKKLILEKTKNPELESLIHYTNGRPTHISHGKPRKTKIGKYCPKCKKSFNPKYNICPYCGTRLLKPMID